MLFAAAATVVLSLSSGTAPNTYSERWLCDLWAGAQCAATSCEKDGKERCEAVSKQCTETSKKVMVDPAKAEKKVACARALLSQTCGAAKPTECDGLM
ncbi:MAG: hypothetical protein JNG84_15265 [Archangium sp.]|nr:hypothetical protein [Archangium sp.]